MRCVNCGKETEQGTYAPDGFLCSDCSSSLGYLSCEGCGLKFKQTQLKSYGGGQFCPNCYKRVAPKPPPAKPKTPAAAAAPIGMRREKLTVKGSYDITPGEVRARAASILAGKSRPVETASGKEETKGKKESISSVLSTINDIIRGRYGKKKRYSVDIK